MIELVITKLTVAADDVVALHLSAPDGHSLPSWQPGAHIDLVLPTGIERQYSLCGDPANDQEWRIAVLREPDGRGGSRYVHEALHAGDTVQARGPRNHFSLIPSRRYLFIAGGIGITPILPMLTEASEAGRDWRLTYGGRRGPSMAFVDELAVHGSRVTFWPQDSHGLIPLSELLGEPDPELAVYCCGPEPLIAAVESQMVHWPTGCLHVERFRPQEIPDSGADTAFEVYLSYSDLTLTVDAGQSIVEAVEAAGVEVFTSCREGICGTCETPVLEGIPEHRDSVLTAEERAGNTVMMICCGRARTPRLVLDL